MRRKRQIVRERRILKYFCKDCRRGIGASKRQNKEGGESESKSLHKGGKERKRIKDNTKMEKKEKESKRPQKGGERERESIKDHTSEVVREQ